MNHVKENALEDNQHKEKTLRKGYMIPTMQSVWRLNRHSAWLSDVVDLGRS